LSSRWPAPQTTTTSLNRCAENPFEKTRAKMHAWLNTRKDLDTSEAANLLQREHSVAFQIASLHRALSVVIGFVSIVAIALVLVFALGGGISTGWELASQYMFWLPIVWGAHWVVRFSPPIARIYKAMGEAIEKAAEAAPLVVIYLNRIAEPPKDLSGIVLALHELEGQNDSLLMKPQRRNYGKN
jgi:hypothetical protein